MESSRIHAVVLITASCVINNFVPASSTLSQSFEYHGVIPDVVTQAPDAYLTVQYQNGVEVFEGNELTPSQVQVQPKVTWDADPTQYYTLALVDPDAPSRQKPSAREWKHWLVVNIPGNNVGDGETLTSYRGSAPPQGTGFHRYIFLVYKQPFKLNFERSTSDKRNNFSIGKFAQRYNFGVPTAGNFFQAQYDGTY